MSKFYKKLSSSKYERFIGMLLMIILILLLVPFMGSYRVADYMIFSILVLAWNLLYGFMGRLSFGHYLFFGCGAYGAGLMLVNVSGNPFLAILVGVLAATVAAMFVGIFGARATGAAFALLMAAFNRLGWFTVSSPLKNITKGEDGFGIMLKRVGFINLMNSDHLFIFVLILFVVIFYLLTRLTSSPFGILIRSIKENENRVRFLGYNTYFYKWLTIVISGAIAGLAGTLNAINFAFVNPNSMDVHANVFIVFACLIGGAGKHYGAVIGGFLYMFLSNFIPVYFDRWELFLGIVLLIIVFRFTGGIWGEIVGLFKNKTDSDKKVAGGEVS